MSGHQWMIDVGRYEDGQRMLIPVFGWGGAHALAGGASGSGKTRFLHVSLARMARQFGALIQFLILDPHMVEFDIWEPRAACVAYGGASAGPFLAGVMAEMRRRFVAMKVGGLGRTWRPDLVDVIGPYLVVLIDEVAQVRRADKNAEAHLISIAQEGRKAGVGLVLAAQSPKARTISNDVKENMPVRWCGRTEEPEQTDTLLGSQTRWLAHSSDVIPEEAPGVAFVRDGRRVRLGRTTAISDEALALVIRETAGDVRPVPGVERVIYPPELAAALAAAGRSV